MDILQSYKSPLFPKISRLLNRAKERLLCGSTMTLGEYLSKKPSFIEKRNTLLGMTNLSKISHTSINTIDNRSVILVVAILIVTATYQAGFTPPGGYWQDDSESHSAGEMTMTVEAASFFYFFNGVAFFSSLYVIMILITGLPKWMVLYGSTTALGIANFASFAQTFPYSDTKFGGFGAYFMMFHVCIPTGYSVLTITSFCGIPSQQTLPTPSGFSGEVLQLNSVAIEMKQAVKSILTLLSGISSLLPYFPHLWYLVCFPPYVRVEFWSFCLVVL